MTVKQHAKRASWVVRRRLNELRGRDVRWPVQVRCRRLMLGSEYGAWTVCPDLISRESIVYSFGLGRDITWDLGMIRRFGVTVHGFDPTPKSVAWIARQPLPPQFVFHNLGIADFDGTARFAQETDNPEWDSFVLNGDASQSGREVEARVARLSTIMRDLGHDHVDVLKMDIESSEYPVIRDLAASAIRPRQLLVEMHYRFGQADDLARLREALETIQRLGYRLFAREGLGHEFSFVLDRPLPATR